ncbi:cupin domain-containing protein [Streptomyces sp. MP131-18]|uniref:cupin domain-containing protein n=1 Tax=Streptomyces sp. MP131-18 TaxID=1857892 RepID=UPI00097BAB00|nr:cupin domain-containing protein [Streptomyces sp. MP131-18]ONK13228.1 hypothetical protein STBA_39910 [Streptomyces sp. MP131-18]
MPLKIVNLEKTALRILTEGLAAFGADATFTPLHTNGALGADMLRVAPGDAFPVHTHPGDHLLLCVKGTGTISVGGTTYTVGPGDLYMVPGTVPHAVGAAENDEHILLAIGAPHFPVDSPERLMYTDWQGNPLTEAYFHQDDVSEGRRHP